MRTVTLIEVRPLLEVNVEAAQNGAMNKTFVQLVAQDDDFMK
jgi:hypothetical protein